MRLNSILITIAVVASAGTQVQAQTLCSTATLRGSYGVQITGTRPAATILSGIQATPGATEQVVGVAIQVFDGVGGFTQTDNVKGSLSGITLNRSGSGTYSINTDCTGTYTVHNPEAPPIVNQLVIVDNGQSFMTAVVSPQPVLVTATGRKMSYVAGCALDTVPMLAAVTDINNAPTLSAKGTLAVWGQGFTPAGGNALVFQRSGYPDVVLTETTGSYFWDYSSGQINAALSGLLAPGAWNLTVHSACSATPSNTLSVTIN